MKKKVWDITVKDNPNRVVMGENDEFYTTDTEAYLVFKLEDDNFNPTSAVLTLENRNDGSLKNETVNVVDGLIEWEMPQRYIEHFGNWQGQLVYEDTKDGQPELYTSATFTFAVNAHIGDKKKPSLVEIENWEKFIREGTELIETWEDLEALREENERQRGLNELARESAESVRVSNEEERELNEVERISKDSERDSKIEAVEGLQADIISGAVDSAAVQQHVEQRYGQLEEEYAPKLTEVTAQLAQKANKTEVDAAITSMGSASPKGAYTTLSALQTAYPTGTSGIYVVTGDGKWYYWSGSAWTVGGTYQSTGIGMGGVKYDNLDASVKDSIMNGSLVEKINAQSISTQPGQTVNFTYDSEILKVKSSGIGGGIPTFDVSGYDQYSYTVGDSVGWISFLPIFGIEKGDTYNGVSVTKYLTVRRASSTSWLVKSIYISDVDGTEAYNADLFYFDRAATLATGDVVNISNYNGLISIYSNDILVIEYDMGANFPGYSFCGGVFLAGFTGSSSLYALSNVTLYINNIKRIEKSIASLERDIESPSNNSKRPLKIAHFSFDDVIVALKDITDNESIYTSIFDNSFFAYLKSMNDQYGTTFSCYCFYTDSTVTPFTLSDCTNKFANEFTSNADWLKFGFHSYDGNTNYASATASKASSDYSLVITELVRITGHIDCIDRVPRLHNYAGNTESMIAMRDSACGILGFLTSQDVRANYYLTDSQNNYIYTHDKLYDANTYLTMFKTTSIAIDFNTMNTLDKANERNIVEVFTHEVQLDEQKALVTAFCKWAYENGYSGDFPMNLLLP